MSNSGSFYYPSALPTNSSSKSTSATQATPQRRLSGQNPPPTPADDWRQKAMELSAKLVQMESEKDKLYVDYLKTQNKLDIEKSQNRFLTKEIDVLHAKIGAVLKYLDKTSGQEVHKNANAMFMCKDVTALVNLSCFLMSRRIEPVPTENHIDSCNSSIFGGSDLTDIDFPVVSRPETPVSALPNSAGPMGPPTSRVFRTQVHSGLPQPSPASRAIHATVPHDSHLIQESSLSFQEPELPKLSIQTIEAAIPAAQERYEKELEKIGIPPRLSSPVRSPKKVTIVAQTSSPVRNQSNIPQTDSSSPKPPQTLTRNPIFRVVNTTPEEHPDHILIRKFVGKNWPGSYSYMRKKVKELFISRIIDYLETHCKDECFYLETPLDKGYSSMMFPISVSENLYEWLNIQIENGLLEDDSKKRKVSGDAADDSAKKKKTLGAFPSPARQNSSNAAEAQTPSQPANATPLKESNLVVDDLKALGAKILQKVKAYPLQTEWDLVLLAKIMRDIIPDYEKLDKNMKRHLKKHAKILLRESTGEYFDSWKITVDENSPLVSAVPKMFEDDFKEFIAKSLKKTIGDKLTIVVKDS